VCEVCALELSTGPASRWPFAVAFLGFALAICAAGARATQSWLLWGGTIVLALLIAVGIGLYSPKREPERRADIRERDLELGVSPELLEFAAHPYRTRIARAARRVVPLSGRSTALVMAGAFVASGVALPLGLKLPHWVELELVLASWWLGIFVLLAALLYRNLRLAEDHRLKLSGLSSAFEGSGEKKSGWKRTDLPTVGSADAGGCGEVLVIGGVLVVALSAAWVLVELVLPVLFFLFYYFVVKAIGRVARDHHGCERNLGRSLFWGATWSTLYVAPVALVTWGAHSFLVLHAHDVATPSSSATENDECGKLGRELARTEARLAHSAPSCARDEDCVCYGGPVCPNALVRVCPSPLHRDVYRELQPIGDAWRANDCGGYLWSPYYCETKCSAGRCVSVERR
jgi:hypothetical protein